jgi:hypothetical protein
MQSSGETRRGNENVCLSVVIASQRVRAKRGTMTGSAKQSRATRSALDCFVASLLAMTEQQGPGLRPDDGYFPVHTGLRFSPNAFMPSFASSVIASSAIWLSV